MPLFFTFTLNDVDISFSAYSFQTQLMLKTGDLLGRVLLAGAPEYFAVDCPLHVREQTGQGKNTNIRKDRGIS